MSFKDLGFVPEILKALDDLGYEKPTPIQAQAIPAAMQGRDVLGIAQTGTGKTGAFTLPILQRMATGRARARMPRCLIVCPTRELAAQVAENVEEYGKYLKISMALLIGGVSFAEQEAKLNRGVDVLIATPGRLLDHFERGKILLTGVQALVVDEADRMLDMGFIPDIERIFKLTPFTRQVLFFSATMPNEIKRLVDQFLHQPHHVQIARKNMTAKTVTQRIVRMPKGDSKQKRTALRYVLENSDVKNGIIFCNRKRDVDIVAKSLNVHGHDAAPIHGDLPQSVRTKTLEDFKGGKLKFLVASDVAARGLDVPSVSHVFNYDVPSHSEDYVHRIGRTGRAGRKGETIMFVTPMDDKYYAAILDLINVKEIEEMEIPGLADFPTESRDRKYGNNKGRGKGKGRDNRNNRDSHKNRNTDKDKQHAKPDNSQNKQTGNDQKPKTEHPKKEHPQKTQPQKNHNAKTDNKPQHYVKPTQTSHAQGQNTGKNKYKRDALPKNTESGFGNSMPAFFSVDKK
ncbi:MAG: RNA helicase [Robiginitomaculum sp.]|nr:MAG: RNA helicase [Robiginitomaculum sp.]